MALSVTHSTVVVVPDDGTSPVGSDEWNAGHTLSGFGTGVQTFLETPSSANLRAAITDETGTGSAVFNTSPTLSGVVSISGSLLEFAGAVLIDQYVEMPEIVAPSAPAANTARLFIQDNGSGKTQLAVRFPSGAVQVIATEP